MTITKQQWSYNWYFRTPLNVVLIGLSLLNKPEQIGTPIDAAHHELVGEISDSCKIAVSILDDLLAYEKIESGLFTLERSRVHFASLIAESTKPFYLSASAKGLQLNVMEDLNEDTFKEIFVEVDVAKISQVIRNFLSNACKFTPTGGIVSVSVHLQPEGAPTAVTFKVRDTGAGISHENLKRVFREIIQFHAGKLQEGKGSGLGLFVSRQIVELHGGSVHVESGGEGCGSEFSFELPLLMNCATPEEPRRGVSSINVIEDIARTSRKDLPAHTIFQSTARHGSSPIVVPHFQRLSHVSEDQNDDSIAFILIVDDSDVNRKMMRRLISSMGHNVEEAEDGAEALAKLQKAVGSGKKYVAILMDFYMPRMHGPEATKAIRALGYSGNIIGITGNGIAEDRDEFMKSGLDSILIKPIGREDLEKALRRGLN